jgi:uncharacterized membrane protein YdbT with pleckstrin-like domain
MERGGGEYVIYEGHPSWRGILSFYARGVLVAAVAGGIAALASLAFDDGVNAAWVSGAVVAVLAVVVLVGLFKRIATTYTVTSERLRIRQGILSKSVKETRLHRVQNVNTHQSVVDRMLNVGKVDFDTAGTDDYEFAFTGIADPHGIAEKVDRASHEAVAPAEPSGL